MSLKTRLLGFVPLTGLDDLHAALSAVPGPAVRVRRGPGNFPGGGIAALSQTEPDASLQSRGREAMLADLRTVQRRLEIACQAGPFLPMDPATACCPDDAVEPVLRQAWDGLAAGLARYGDCHQWDISLRWQPEPVVMRARESIAAAAGRGAQALAEAVAAALRAERERREAAVIAALAPVVLDFAAGGAAGTETEIVVTILVAAAGISAVEAALEGMAPADVADTAIDMRGPLPPLSFHPVRLANAEPGDISSAWRQLDLPARITRASLHQHWRRRAAAAHPDRHAGTTDTPDSATNVSDITDAYRLLRDLLPPDGADGLTQRDLLDRAGHRLVTPDPAGPSHATTDALETVS